MTYCLDADVRRGCERNVAALGDGNSRQGELLKLAAEETIAGGMIFSRKSFVALNSMFHSHTPDVGYSFS
jgi:hypothetical protein